VGGRFGEWVVLEGGEWGSAGHGAWRVVASFEGWRKMRMLATLIFVEALDEVVRFFSF
jgi:hypothetical protein